MCIDFRRSAGTPSPSVIHGQQVDLVKNYKYLGTVIDSQLKFDMNCEVLCKKGQQRMFCLRKLAKFQVDRTLLKMFYHAFIESVISFCLVCWYGNLSVRNKTALGRVVTTCSKVAGVKFDSLDNVFNDRMQKLLRCIMRDETHPLHDEYRWLPSGHRLAVPPMSTNRYKFSFVPLSIQAFNKVENRRKR